MELSCQTKRNGGISTRTGWWFGCHFLFSHILGIIIPIDFHIFQRVHNNNNDNLVMITIFIIAIYIYMKVKLQVYWFIFFGW